MKEEQISVLKKGIWLYFLLLIFEGGLRKWILPGLATPLLIVRDPVALFLLVRAWQHQLFKFNFYVFLVIAIASISFFTSLFSGHKNLFVALYGLRIWLLHFPLIFLIGNIFDRADVIKIGKFLLYITPLMTVLIALQFYSPQSAFINRGVGGDIEGGGFSGALGFFRPPGTFSFTNGNGMYFSMVALFVFYFWLQPGHVNKWILIISTIGLIAAIPLSISRSLFFSIAVSFAFVIAAVFFKPRYLSSVAIICIAGLAGIIVLGKANFFNTAMDAFTARFEMANEIEGGLKGVLGDRYLGGMLGALTNGNDALPFWGYGLGMGTNVGSMLLTGTAGFLISEGEWGRMIGEMGPLLGLLIIIIRMGFCLSITVTSFKNLISGDLLPWILLSFALINIPQGQWAQPTALGFGVLIAGLLISSLKSPISAENIG